MDEARAASRREGARPSGGEREGDHAARAGRGLAVGASTLQVGRATRAEGPRATLLRVAVGPHQVVFDLRTILAIEGASDRVEHEAIRGPLDVRTAFGVEGAPDPESVLVPAYDAVYRLEVCRIGQLVQTDLRAVHRLPHVLGALLAPLAVRGLVSLPAAAEDERAAGALLVHRSGAAGAGGVAFLVDPVELAQRVWSARG